MRAKAAKADQSKISVPITVRTLETIIRLATAHAKMRLSREVVNDDIQMAASLLLHTIFQEEQEGLNEKFPDKHVEEEEMIGSDNNETTAKDATFNPSFPAGNRTRQMGNSRV